MPPTPLQGQREKTACPGLVISGNGCKLQTPLLKCFGYEQEEGVKTFRKCLLTMERHCQAWISPQGETNLPKTLPSPLLYLFAHP